MPPFSFAPACLPSYCSGYRGFYIINWIYRFLTERHYRQWLVWVSGVVQTLIYADFFYFYLQAWKSNKRLQLPA